MDTSDDSGTLLDVIPSNEMASDRKSVNKQLHETMQRAIAALSDEQREVFLMREFLDLPFKQIAEVVGVPENTVKSRMRYALEGLRKALLAAGVSAEVASDDAAPGVRLGRA